MDTTKRPFVLPLTCYWLEHFSTWVIRDGDNHQIGQVDNEQKADLIVKAVNVFDDLVDLLESYIAEWHNDAANFYRKEPDSLKCARALLAKVKEE